MNTNQPIPSMSQFEIEVMIDRVGKKAAREVMHETFKMLGVDLENQSEINHFRADLVHVRSWRRLMEAIRHKAILAVIVAGTLWVGLLVWENIGG